MKLSKLAGAILLANLSFGIASVYAADAPTLTSVLGASGVTMSGYVDAAYTHFDTDTTGTVNAFDSGSTNTFSLKQAAITIAKQPTEGFGGLVNLTFGNEADVIASTPTNTTDNFDVTQAFAQYTSGALTVIGGKFVTLSGAEVITATANSNISRSIAFFNAIAYTHTGVRAAYTPMAGVTLYLGSNNGWDTQKDTANKGKTTELGATWTSDMVSVAAQAYSGQETVGTLAATRTLFDTVITVKPTKELSLVLNYDTAKQEKGSAMVAGEDAKWNAIVGYINYQINDKTQSSLRLEQFDDKGGMKLGTVADVNGVAQAQKVQSITLTGAYAAADNFVMRGEIRQDKSNQKAYMKDSKATDKQMYFAVEGIYKF